MRNTILISAIVLSMTGGALADPYHDNHYRNQNYNRHHGSNILPWIAGGAALGIAGAIIATQPRCWYQREESFDRYGNFIGYHDVRYCQ